MRTRQAGAGHRSQDMTGPTPADHPFFCSIVDNKTGLVLFMGSIFAPEPGQTD